MTTNKDRNSVADFLRELREFKEEAIVANEPCPEGHRRDPDSGRCLPLGGMDHTAVTRSVNVDNGPEWRGQAATDKETAVDADDMESRESCAEGTTFSFIQGKCISLEEAEKENSEEFARDEFGNPVEEEVEESAVPGSGGHLEITLMQPEGRRDTVNHECPPNQAFDYGLRKCIPLNKDTVMASDLDNEFKKAVARYISGKLAITSPDPLDSHYHLVTVDRSGNGMTSVSYSYRDDKSYYHSHNVSGYIVEDYEDGDYLSQHFGHVIPKEMWEYDSEANEDKVKDIPVTTVGTDSKETAAPITTKQRKALPDSVFGVPGKRKFPLDTCNRVRNAMARFNQAKGLTSGEKATLKRKILAAAKKCNIKVSAFAKASTDEEYVAVANSIMVGLEFEINEHGQIIEDAARITTKQRKALPDSAFGVPGKRKFPLDTCARVRNAMARFNQAKGLTSSEKATLRRKILAAAKKCGIEVRKFAKAETDADFAAVISELVFGVQNAAVKERVEADYQVNLNQGPCPPGMIWDASSYRCSSVRGFVSRMNDSHSDTEDAESRVLTPDVPGKPARIAKDCPPGTVWHAIRKDCLPLDSRQKTKSSNEDAAVNLANREGLVPAPAGQVKLSVDCPEGTMWDTAKKTCTPLSTADKNRPSGPNPQPPTNKAAEIENQVERLSLNRIIKYLDTIIKEDVSKGRKEKAKVDAKDLPNAAFPPSLVSSTRRNLMHHLPTVEDPYDHGSVDVPRLRNALARCDNVDGFSEKAVEDAKDHLLFHAHEVVKEYLEKK